MSIITIILFFLYSWGFGYGATRFIKNSDNFFERNLMRIGIGLAIVPLVGVALNLFNIPIDWKIFLVLSLVFPVYGLFKQKKEEKQKFSMTKSNIYILIVIILFAITFFMYMRGAFSYPYLEDSDPWDHSFSTKYIAAEKQASEPIKGKNLFSYVDPYPPGYDILMAILYQTSGEMIWTLKFFNSLIISLGIIFFYFFVRDFLNDKNKALFATFVMASIPSYLSHFIWAHSLAVSLIFPAFYCVGRINADKNWRYVAAVVIAGILVIQPEQAIKFGVLFSLYLIVKFFFDKKSSKHIFIAGIGGLILSMLWWGQKAMSMLKEAAFLSKEEGSIFATNIGTASRAYTFNDIVFAKSQNMINNPIGIGPFICILAAIALIVLIFKYKEYIKKENSCMFIVLLWLVFTFLGTNSVTFNLPIGFFAFRFWMLLAIPLSILAAEGMWLLKDFSKQFNGSTIIMLIFIIGILMTSAYPKYSINTSIWPSTGVIVQDELQGNGYSWMEKNIQKGTGVFTTSKFYSAIPAYDLNSKEWNPSVIDYRSSGKILNQTASEFHEWLVSNSYRYIIIDHNTILEYGNNLTNSKISEYVSSNLFQPVHQTQSMVILQVK